MINYYFYYEPNQLFLSKIYSTPSFSFPKLGLLIDNFSKAILISNEKEAQELLKSYQEQGIYHSSHLFGQPQYQSIFVHGDCIETGCNCHWKVNSEIGNKHIGSLKKFPFCSSKQLMIKEVGLK